MTVQQRLTAPRRPQAEQHDSGPTGQARLGVDRLDQFSILGLQRHAGNGVVTALLVQRQPKPPGPRDAKHPENFPTYEGWLETFGSLPTFDSDDTVPADQSRSRREEEASHKVYGIKAKKGATSEHEKAPTPIGPVRGDKFIDHPTDDWVKANLPDELRVVAYQLPANCADVAVVLRHVWLFKHNRSETYKSFVVGTGAAGESDQARTKRVGQAIAGISTINVAGMVNPYTDSAGHPLRSIAVLGPLLHPGDILVWAHHAPEKGPAGPTAARSGGHTHTIVSIERHGGVVTTITALQGNQPLNKESGEDLRFAPGRRIEQGLLTHDRLQDTEIKTTIMVKGKPKVVAEQVWIWGDGNTTLVAAGPPRSGARPAAGKEDGKERRRLSDWLRGIVTADRRSLTGVVEASMREALAMLEAGVSQAEVEGEARSLGRAASLRIDALNAALAKAGKPADPTLRQEIGDVLSTLETGHGSTKAAAARSLFGVVIGAFEGRTAQPGWSGVAATNINFGETVVGHVRRIPLDGLPGGAPRAIVAVPATMVGGKKPVDVLLHFHGWGTDFKTGRDATTDRIEAQLEASGRRMVAILPQGGPKSQFGTFNFDDYADKVFAKLKDLGVWGVLGPPSRGRLIVSGHSGGGMAAMDLVSGRVPGLGTDRPAEVALFDGINGPDELDVATTWVEEQLNAASKLLEAPAVKGNANKEDAILAGVVFFRAYHSGSETAPPSRKIRDWPGLHATLRIAVEKLISNHGGELSPHALGKLHDHFRIVATDQPVKKHENRIGGPAGPGDTGGALLDALRAPK